MSIQAVAAVLDYSAAVKGTRLTAISLANHADKHGVCFPSVRLAAQEAKLSERAVQNGIKALRDELGELEVLVEAEGKTHRPPLYRLALPGLSGEVGDDHAYFLAFGPRADIAPGPGAESAPDPLNGLRPPGEAGFTPPGADNDSALYREPSVKPSGNQQQPVDPISQVYDFWKPTTGRNGGTKLTPGRRRAVKARLEEGRTVEEICRAVGNVAASDWHMKRGRYADREGMPQNDLVLICRNGETLEKYVAMGGAAATPGGKPAALNPIVGEAEADRVWVEAKLRLRAAIPDSTYRLWIEPFEAAGERGGKLVLVDSRETGGGARQWAERRYTALVLQVLADIGAEYSGVEFVDETQLEYEAR